MATFYAAATQSRKLVCAVVCVGSVVSQVAVCTVSAQPAPQSSRQSAPIDPVSPEVATGIAVGSTLLGFALLGATASLRDGDGLAPVSQKILFGMTIGVFCVGPSWGRWYAREPAVGTIIVRSLALGMLVGAAQGVDGEDGGLAVVLPPALAVIVVTTLYDMARADGAARDYNQAHHKRRVKLGVALNLGPAVIPTQSGGYASGLVLGGVF